MGAGYRPNGKIANQGYACDNKGSLPDNENKFSYDILKNDEVIFTGSSLHKILIELPKYNIFVSYSGLYYRLVDGEFTENGYKVVKNG